MLRSQELVDSRCRGLSAGLLLKRLAQVLEEVQDRFTLLSLLSLLEEHARALLVHDNVDSFIRWIASLLSPLVRDAR